MKTSKDIREELEQLSPLLSRMKAAEKPVETPENFFREMQADVLWKVKQEALAGKAAPPAKPTAAWWEQILQGLYNVVRQPVYATALATLTLLIAAAIWLLTPEKADTPQFSELTQEEALEYIESNLEEFDTALLLSAFGESAAIPAPTSGMSDQEAKDLMDAMMKELDAGHLQELF